MSAASPAPVTPDSADIARPARFGVSPNVFKLGVVSFFADVSSEMLYPLTPIFLTTVLGAPVAVVGLIEGIAEGTASITRLFGGMLSDRFGVRRPFVTLGYGMAAVGKLLLAIATVWQMALLARFVDRLGKGLRTGPRDALLADSALPEHRGRAFGFHRSADTAGAVLGPLLAIGLLALLQDQLRIVFLLAVLPGLLAVLAMLPVREAPIKPSAGEAPRFGIPNRQFGVFLAIFTLFAITNSSDVFLILRAQSLGLSKPLIVLAYVLYNVVYMSLSLPAGIVSDRIGRRNVLVTGLALFSLVYVGFAATTSAAWVWPLFLVYGGYIALTDGVAKALVADFVPSESRATALGAFAAATGVGVLIASVAAGLLWDLIGPWAPFALGAAGAAVAAVLLLALVPARVSQAVANL